MPDLATAYRPRDFDEVIGNKSTVESLKLICQREKNKFPKCILLSGPRGCGKSTLARIIAKHLGAFNEESDYNPDFRVYDLGNTRGIDNARAIVQEMQYGPSQGDSIVFLLEECHGATKDFWTCLLLNTEEPPDHVFFILCTTEPEKLLDTVRSRCTPFTVNALASDEIVDILLTILREELVWSDDSNFLPDNDFLLKNYPSAILQQIIRNAEGCPRNAIKLLDKVIDIENEADAIATIEQTFFGETSIKDICDLLLANREKQEKWQMMAKLLITIRDTRGQQDPEKIRRGVITFLTKVMSSNPSPGTVAMQAKCLWNNYYETGFAGLIMSCFTACQI